MQVHVALELLHIQEAGTTVFKAADADVVFAIVLLLQVCTEVRKQQHLHIAQAALVTILTVGVV